MNYLTGAFETKLGPKPAGYQIYKFLVLKDIIPRSGTSLDEVKNHRNCKKNRRKGNYRKCRKRKKFT